MTPRTGLLALALLAALVTGARSAPAQEPFDSGRFIVYERGVAVAHEDFRYDVFTDSIVVTSETSRKLRNAEGEEQRFTKNMTLIANGFDFGLLHYASNQRFRNRLLINGFIAPESGDTACTAYVELDGSGTSTRLTHPPGYLFLIDSQLYTLFDVMARVLGRQTFDSRPVHVLLYSEQPEMIEAGAKSVAPDTLRWGGRRLIAKRFQLGDQASRFLLTVSPEGGLLRLVQPEAGVEVIREAPKVKPVARRRPRT